MGQNWPRSEETGPECIGAGHGPEVAAGRSLSQCQDDQSVRAGRGRARRFVGMGPREGEHHLYDGVGGSEGRMRDRLHFIWTTRRRIGLSRWGLGRQTGSI